MNLRGCDVNSLRARGSLLGTYRRLPDRPYIQCLQLPQKRNIHVNVLEYVSLELCLLYSRHCRTLRSPPAMSYPHAPLPIPS